MKEPKRRRTQKPPKSRPKDTTGYLKLPRRGFDVLAKIAWPNDQAGRRQFLKSGLRRHSMSEISFDEFTRVRNQVEFLLSTGQLNQADIFPLTRQLEDWGISQRAQEWRWAQERIVKEAEAGYLLLPHGGTAVLGKIAWPDDQIAQRRFLKSGRRHASKGISIDEFSRVLDQNLTQVVRQLEEWGIFRKAFEWLLAPDVVQVPPAWIEQQRRDLIWENLELKGYLLKREHRIKAARRRGGKSNKLKHEPMHALIRETAQRMLEEHPLLKFSTLLRNVQFELGKAAQGEPPKGSSLTTIRRVLTESSIAQP
jgi:hypothetical protein